MSDGRLGLHDEFDHNGNPGDGEIPVEKIELGTIN
jgi:hypothetical protein